jgi:formamidopyrimidine-DNA glycosylase
VAANVGYGLSKHSEHRIGEMLELVGLTGLDNRMPHELSGGQQQRVALARAIAPEPEVILLDEPFSNLDASLRGRVRREVRDILAQAHISALFVTHDQEEALAIADAVAVMNEGRVLQVASPDVIYANPISPWVAGFLGEADFIEGRAAGGRVDTPLGVFATALSGPVRVMLRPETVPELPEVESIRRMLAPALVGRQIESVEVLHPRTARRNVQSSDVVDRLRGARVVAVNRRGKFLIAPLDREMDWVIHLGMSGRVALTTPGEPRLPHTHFVAVTGDGVEIRFIDPRTFGFVGVFTPAESKSIDGLGPDALTALPRSAELAGRLVGRRAPIKALLLDQRLVSGLGNIYADEILFRAAVRPTRPGGELVGEEISKLRAAIRPVLRAGIAAGGTSLDDLAYLLPDGRAGDNLRRLAVYGREGEPCRRCGTPIERLVVGGRSSFFCPRCQT